MARQFGRRSRREDGADAVRCRSAGVLALAAALCLGGGTAALAVSARVTSIDQTMEDSTDGLELPAVAHHVVPDGGAGGSARWEVTAHLPDTATALLRIDLHASGEPVEVRLQPEACPEPWSFREAVPRCARGSEPASLRMSHGEAGGAELTLESSTGEPEVHEHLLFMLDGEALEPVGSPDRLALTVTVRETDGDRPPPDEVLAAAGAPIGLLGALGMVAAGLAGLGVAALVIRRAPE